MSIIVQSLYWHTQRTCHKYWFHGQEAGDISSLYQVNLLTQQSEVIWC